MEYLHGSRIYQLLVHPNLFSRWTAQLIIRLQVNQYNVDLAELVLPRGVVEALAMIVSVVIITIGFRMVERRQRAHFGSVGRVLAEEFFHLFGYLRWSDRYAEADVFFVGPGCAKI